MLDPKFYHRKVLIYFNFISMNSFLKKQPSQVCFKRWGNKSYSAFNSLNKCVKIGVLCVGYTLLVSPERNFAQTDTTHVKVIDLDEVEISADVAPDIYAQTGRSITQVTRTTIEYAAVQSLIDLLEYVPNVDLRQRGPFGTQADVTVRGSSFDQTLVLLNGINISDPQTGHYTLNLPIDLESVEKIEVLEGPAARIFGNNALGGAVNFITGVQPGNYLKAFLTGGQHGFYKAALTGTFHTRQTTHHLAVSRTASDGYMHNTDFSNLNVFSQNRWNSSSFPLDLQLGYTQKDYGANGFYGPKYSDQYESLNTFYVALKGETTGKVKISPDIYWRRNYDHYVLIRNNPEAYQNFHYTDIFGADINASLTSRIGKTSIGLLARGERIYSTNLGKDMDHPRKVPRQDGQYYTRTDHRTNTSVFAEQNIHIGKWSASAGILFNHNNYTGTKLNVYPGIDLAFHPNNTFKIYASANQAMRLPTFTDLYYEGPMNMGNPDLKPERSTEYELGTKISSGNWNANVSYFYRTITDVIDWVWLSEEQVWHTQNFSELNTHGISLYTLWNIQRACGADFWIRSLSASYNFMSSGKQDGKLQSYYALDYLKHKLGIGLTHRIVEKVNAHWQIGWQDRNGSYMQYNTSDESESEAPYEAFWQIDLRVYRQTGRWNIFVEASNLTNQKHQDIGNITLPGLWARAGVSVTIGGKVEN